MMKIGVLGAGISGLSIAQLLKDSFDVEVLEKNAQPGGIARTKDIDGIPYHMVGGHCFNSKHQDVLDFVFNTILPITEWRKVERKSKIQFYGHEISYPIEFSVKEIYEFDPTLAFQATSDFLSVVDDNSYSNLEEWFIKKFGKTFAEKYFLPYNSKIWNNDPKKMSSSWVEDKLPIPNKFDFFESLLNKAKDKMSHAQFYYPKSNNQNTFIDHLAKGLNIKNNYQVHKIEKKEDGWVINDEKKYDLIINTLPLKEVPSFLVHAPENVKEAARKLKYNKVSNIFWKTDLTDKTWTYIPDKEFLFHRFIHIGAYLSPLQPYSISEVVGEHSFEEMKNAGKRNPFLKEPLDYNISDYAYVVFDENYQECTTLIKEYLQESGLFTLGRFGEWQYYNMDICIKKTIDLSKKIKESEKSV
ncbi:MAG: NAD(P)-binding protein [Candidatus Azobacteroides sp.]|nr:NAD(P)-binding protein [Candidatus Azobacteroides sp.]